MAGDPTQTEPGPRESASPDFAQWYLVTDDGTSGLRVIPGLAVGEADSGALAVNDPSVRNQWVEFVFTDGGEPWATIVTRDKSLRVDGSTRVRHPLRVGTTLRLPNNTLHVSHELTRPQASGSVVEVVHRDVPERPQDLVGPEWVELLAAVRESHAGPAEARVPSDPATATVPEMRIRPMPNRDARDDWSDHTGTTADQRGRAEPPSTARRRQVPVMTGVLALGAVVLVISVALIVPGGKDETSGLTQLDRPPAEAPSVDSRTATSAPARSSGDTSPPAPVADTGAGPSAAPQSRAAQAVDAASPPPSTAAPSRNGERLTMHTGAEPEQVTPVVPPPLEHRSIPQPARTEVPADRAAAPTPKPRDRTPDPALVAKLEEIGEQAQIETAELARRRDLLAAELALKQGRLTTPSASSAYTLYTRVLAQDPASPEATRGLQSVRQALINRAMADLARGAFDDARTALQTAAGAGADPQLVANLRSEVDYRQGRITGTP